ncbi:MAG: hypothetical protein GQ531_03615 [Sulfurovum sp.]|nr:hypothetical protein [Sulfurovum sp.]
MQIDKILVLLLTLATLSFANPQEKLRVISLDGQANFRDIGGYTTEDGHTIKMGKVYRSGELPKLSDADVEKLKKLKVNVVVNFLLKEEIEKTGKDRLPEGTKEVLIPISTQEAQSLVQEANKGRKTGDFSKLPVELNPFVHKLLPKAGASSYASLIREIIKNKEGALVYHCSHGVHRTGTATAIILSLIGVPWKTVREDYLLSNITRKAGVEKRIVQLGKMTAKTKGISFEEVDMTNIKAFYILEGKYIDATRDEIIKEYGSFENYAIKELGLTKKELSALKNAMLK